MSVGLWKAINTASDVASGANKAMPYAYGIARALGVCEAALPILGCVSKGLKKLTQGKEYLQNMRHAIVGKKNIVMYI